MATTIREVGLGIINSIFVEPWRRYFAEPRSAHRDVAILTCLIIWMLVSFDHDIWFWIWLFFTVVADGIAWIAVWRALEEP